MKPLPEVPLTKEDYKIWCRATVIARQGFLPESLGQAVLADRRDADLMLVSQFARADGSWEPIAINRVGRFGGYMPGKRRARVWLS